MTHAEAERLAATLEQMAADIRSRVETEKARFGGSRFITIPQPMRTQLAPIIRALHYGRPPRALRP